jgi:hypothetical protein
MQGDGAKPRLRRSHLYLNFLNPRFFQAASSETIRNDLKNKHSLIHLSSDTFCFTKRENTNMKLAYWMYAGPAHIGTLRVASSFKNVHAIMHAPLGDDYFNVMRSMLERERNFTPVTTSVVDRNVLARGSQEKVVDNITRRTPRPDCVNSHLHLQHSTRRPA